MQVDQEQKFKTFEKKAGVAFRDRSLIAAAFTHRSYINESDPKGTHNERLEFLGDAVIELTVTHHLFTKYPQATEGELTAYRAALVNAAMLGGIGESLGMNECLLLSKGEQKDTGRARATILANTFEAVVGALYLDQGYAAADDFVTRHVLAHADEVVRTGSWKDAKSRFQEMAQAKDGQTPRYETVKAEGPDHDKKFVVELRVGDHLVATGEGKSKQEAEQAAAEMALGVPTSGAPGSTR